MENNGRDPRPPRPELGPRLARRPAPLTSKRAAVLELLLGQPEPTTLAALVAAGGLHPNTLREHLEGLVHQGRVRRSRSEPEGRGRPAWRYEATEERDHSEYAGLAAALAGTIARSSPTPVDSAIEAGEEWGRELVRDRGTARPVGPVAARDEVITLLDDLGFGPMPSPDRPDLLRLTRCPLLEAAHRHRAIVCGVHVGLVRGALEEYGADPTGTDLEPFAVPGACLLAIPPVTREDR